MIKSDYQTLIYDLRGYKVMLDFDLATLYGVETKRLKEQVRRNLSRFPGDFMFELTREELDNLRSQFATSSWGGMRYLPMAFTEQGVAMLSSVLNSEKAIQVNIEIMRAFAQYRSLLIENKDLRKEINLWMRNSIKFSGIYYKRLTNWVKEICLPTARRLGIREKMKIN